MEWFRACFAELEDPRTGNAQRHELDEIVMIALLATLCGAEGGVDMALFGRRKEPLLRQFLRLPGGIPSHDTFARVLRLLDPRGWLPAPTSVVGAERRGFEACFARYLAALSERAQGVVISTVTNRGTTRFMVDDGALKVALFVTFLKRLTRDASRKIFLIVDNLKVHHAKPVQAWVTANQPRIELFFLPSPSTIPTSSSTAPSSATSPSSHRRTTEARSRPALEPPCVTSNGCPSRSGPSFAPPRPPMPHDPCICPSDQ
jgi:hypothetical protein